VRALAVLLALGSTACARAPTARVTWRETWETVALTDDGMLLDARVTIGNTGLLRGQGHLVLDFVPPSSTPLEVRRDASPAAVHQAPDGSTIHFLTDSLEMKPDAWTLVTREGYDVMDATMVLAGNLIPPGSEHPSTVPPTVLVEGSRQWTVGAPIPLGTLAGAWRSAEQGGLLRGYGCTIHRSGDISPSGTPERTAVYAFGPDWSFVAETRGSTGIGWYADAAGVRTSRTVSLTRDGDRIRVSLEPQVPVVANLEAGEIAMVSHPWSNLIFFERWTASVLWDPPDREIRLGRIRVRGIHVIADGHAAMIRTGPSQTTAASKP